MLSLERLSAYADLIRIRRPIGIYLLLWPALWGLWVAGQGIPDWRVLLIFVLGAVFMRSAGCAINDFADRHIDGHVERTCTRPLATGAVSPREALLVFTVLSLTAFGLVLFLNWLTVAMSFVAVFLAALYPFMKRYTHLPQLVLGMAFGWAVPMAFTTLTGTVALEGWLLYLATVIWALIYDTEYAMVDREDDFRIGVKSTAILFGEQDRLIIGLLQAVMLSLLLAMGLLAGLGVFYYLGFGLATASAIYQQYLIRNRERHACFTAFLNNYYFGLFLFLGLLLDYLPL
ncbi:MAG: 4-hydroxybenzoate octaprenyltransferase [Gammaproteobacteria bacterium]|nr:4-hydroxybenzoate octaprenyltransferase [Gammaproteobacteria bacterium]MBU1655873.1 4-hydroxybenzoate octaprenyltransferase [Gammaproteobacteria bacterium]MBU1960616.1 4-hydroxybenzoate octaprenyltransferase [Gammaproteobacteria bacterium]